MWLYFMHLIGAQYRLRCTGDMGPILDPFSPCAWKGAGHETRLASVATIVYCIIILYVIVYDVMIM